MTKRRFDYRVVGGNAVLSRFPLEPVGALGRKVDVVPSLGLVVTRLEDAPNPPDRASFDSEFWKRLMKAAPIE